MAYSQGPTLHMSGCRPKSHHHFWWNFIFICSPSSVRLHLLASLLHMFFFFGKNSLRLSLFINDSSTILIDQHSLVFDKKVEKHHIKVIVIWQDQLSDIYWAIPFILGYGRQFSKFTFGLEFQGMMPKMAT